VKVGEPSRNPDRRRNDLSPMFVWLSERARAIREKATSQPRTLADGLKGSCVSQMVHEFSNPQDAWYLTNSAKYSGLRARTGMVAGSAPARKNTTYLHLNLSSRRAGRNTTEKSFIDAANPRSMYETHLLPE